MCDFFWNFFDKQLKVFVKQKEEEKIGNIFDQSDNQRDECHCMRQDRVVIGPINEKVENETDVA